MTKNKHTKVILPSSGLSLLIGHSRGLPPLAQHLQSPARLWLNAEIYLPHFGSDCRKADVCLFCLIFCLFSLIIGGACDSTWNECSHHIRGEGCNSIIGACRSHITYRVTRIMHCDSSQSYSESHLCFRRYYPGTGMAPFGL